MIDAMRPVRRCRYLAAPARLGRGDPWGVVSNWSRQTPPNSLPENQTLRRVAILGFLASLLYLFASALW